MLIPNFKEYSVLLEGGNAHTKEGDYAAKVKLADFSPEEYEAYKSDIKKLLKQLSAAFQEYSGAKLWTDQQIETGSVISGSSHAFFTVDRDRFVKVKPVMGDMDTQINGIYKDKVIEWLETIKGQEFNGFTYLGSMKIGDVYNIFKAPAKYNPQATNIQIDFEFSEYENDEPSEWDRFVNVTQWEDLEQSIKGLAKNQLIPCIYRTLFFRKGIVYQPKHDKPRKTQSSTFNVPERIFSPKGSRVKFRQVTDAEGNPINHDDLPAFREIPTTDSTFNRNVGSVFAEMFGHEPDDTERKMFKNYIGLLKLMKANIKDAKIIQDIYARYYTRLPNQVPEEERDVLVPIITKFKEVFPFVVDPDPQEEIE